MFTSLLGSIFEFILKIMWVVFLAVCLFPVFIFSLLFPADDPLGSLGNRHLIASYTDGGFQDYTDYQKYQCEDPKLEDNQSFAAIDEASLQILNEYIDDFEGWVIASGEDSSLYQHYDFDRSIIDTADYFYVDDGTDTPAGSKPLDFSNYDVYFFDCQSSILYFFHSNI